jgi:hypothetical protein
MVLIDEFDYELSRECYETETVDDIFTFNPNSELGETDINVINVFQMNIRSIKKNFDQLTYVLQNSCIDFHIIVLTETWVTDEYNFNFKLNGYIEISKPGNLNKCDGVCVFVKDSLSVSAVNLSIAESNSIMIKVKDPKANLELTVIAIYRSPAGNIEVFLEELNECLKSVGTSDNVALVGDLNINIINNSNVTNEYMNIMSINGFKSYINKTTRENMASESCIDHIFLKNSSFDPNNIRGIIFKTSITDHYSTGLILKTIETKRRNTKTMYIESINFNALSSELESDNWDDVIDPNKNANESTKTFINRLVSCVKSVTTKKEVPHKLKPLKNWITAGLVHSIRVRDKMHKKTK